MRPKYSLGQNFLIDKNIVAKILQLADLQRNEIILEIGPGTGALTSALLDSGVQVYAIEKDWELCKPLQNEFGGYKKFTLLEGDALTYDLSQLPTTYKLIANLPYNVATAIIERFFIKHFPPKHAVVMVQYEVAEKITVRPPHGGVLGSFYQSVASVELAHKVSPSCFSPRPKVDSALLCMSPLATPLLPQKNWGAYLAFIQKNFQWKRKKLQTTLVKTSGRSLPEVKTIMDQDGIHENIRPQDLTPMQWKNLWQQLG